MNKRIILSDETLESIRTSQKNGIPLTTLEATMLLNYIYTLKSGILKLLKTQAEQTISLIEELTNDCTTLD